MGSASTLTVEAQTQSLSAVRCFVRRRAAELGLDARAVSELVMAVDETVTNVIVHGYLGRGGQLDIEVAGGEGTVAVRILDEATPFDPTFLPSSELDEPIERRTSGGMGIFFVRQLVDQMIHRARPQGGNELILVKRIGGRSGS